jgi:hypothetical protein
MALDAKIALNPGDLMRLQFPTAEPSCVNAIVRHRNGSRLGLEFLSQLPPDDQMKYPMKSLPAPVSRGTSTARRATPAPCTPKSLLEGLRRKQEELRRLKKEIEALSVAILLLAEDDQEVRGLPIPPRLELENRPWPQA